MTLNARIPGGAIFGAAASSVVSGSLIFSLTLSDLCTDSILQYLWPVYRLYTAVSLACVQTLHSSISGLCTDFTLQYLWPVYRLYTTVSLACVQTLYSSISGLCTDSTIQYLWPVYRLYTLVSLACAQTLHSSISGPVSYTHLRAHET